MWSAHTVPLKHLPGLSHNRKNLYVEHEELIAKCMQFPSEVYAPGGLFHYFNIKIVPVFNRQEIIKAIAFIFL